MNTEICAHIEDEMQCVLSAAHEPSEHRFWFVDDDGEPITLTQAEYAAWRSEHAPCAECGFGRDWLPHTVTAAACAEIMKDQESACANPDEHHVYVADPQY